MNNEQIQDEREEVFFEVIKENCRMLSSRMQSNSENFLYSNRHLVQNYSDDSIRDVAVAFFTKEISERLTELNNSNLFTKKTQ